MSWWKKLFRLEAKEILYGLHADSPVLCGGGVDAEIDYLERLRCPAGRSVRYLRQGSLKRSAVGYLDRKDVTLHVSPGTLRRIGKADPRELPLDAYMIVCECGDHAEQVFIDMYFRGPELPIAAKGWTLSEGISPATLVNPPAPCPYCGEQMRTPRAQQCRFCGMDWHDPNNVHKRMGKAD
jgi:hypothetical protein